MAAKGNSLKRRGVILNTKQKLSHSKSKVSQSTVHRKIESLFSSPKLTSKHITDTKQQIGASSFDETNASRQSLNRSPTPAWSIALISILAISKTKCCKSLLLKMHHDFARAALQLM